MKFMNLKCIRVSFRQMLVMLTKDMMLVAACIGPVFAGVLIKLGIPKGEEAVCRFLGKTAFFSPYYELIDVLFSMIFAVMILFSAAMIVLEERDDKIMNYMSVTPLTKTGYIFSRFGIFTLLSLVITFFGVVLFHLSSLTVFEMFMLSVDGTLQGLIIALMIISFSNNKLEGMGITKASSIIILGAFVPFFIEEKTGVLSAFLPSFWIGLAVHKSIPLLHIPAVVLSGLWCLFLSKWYMKKK